MRKLVFLTTLVLTTVLSVSSISRAEGVSGDGHVSFWEVRADGQAFADDVAYVPEPTGFEGSCYEKVNGAWAACRVDEVE